MAKKVFVSYARPDSAYATRLAKELRHGGLDVWIDQDSLLAGQVWEDEIRKAIYECNYFVALLSSNSINRRGYVQAELNYAFDVFRQVPRGDVFLIPVRLDDCQIKDIRLRDIHYIDLFPIWEEGIGKIVKAILPIIKLRSTPTRSLTSQELEKMVKERDFFSCKSPLAPNSPDNKLGKGLNHQYEVVDCGGEKLVIDYTTGLTWQQSGSSDDSLSYENSLDWIEELNKKEFAGYNDWRLPTVEEAMSLIEPEKHRGLHVSKVFDEAQVCIWTVDISRNSFIWVVDFQHGRLTNHQLFGNSVRAVR